MPYRIVDVDDFDCELLLCVNNDGGSCSSDSDVGDLKANSKNCYHYKQVKNREFITQAEYEVDELIEACEECDIVCKTIDPTSNRLILKTLNDKSGLFRISEEEEKEYYFFSCVDGGVDFVHNSIKEADLFKKE